MKNNTLAAGILCGLAIGTALGILFAPAKGCETRKKIVYKSSDLKDIVKDSTGKLSEKFAQTISHLKKDSEQLFGNSTNILKAEIVNTDNLKSINKIMI